MAKSGAGAPDLVTQVLQFGTGYWVSRLVSTVAEFGVADHSGKGGLVIEKLAKATSTCSA